MDMRRTHPFALAGDSQYENPFYSTPRSSPPEQNLIAQPRGPTARTITVISTLQSREFLYV